MLGWRPLHDAVAPTGMIPRRSPSRVAHREGLLACAARRHGLARAPPGAAIGADADGRRRPCIARRDALATCADHPRRTSTIVVHAIAIVVERITNFYGRWARTTVGRIAHRPIDTIDRSTLISEEDLPNIGEIDVPSAPS
jgi:hypothetical protein